MEAAAWKALLRHAALPNNVASLLPVGKARLSALFPSQALVQAADGGDVWVTTAHDRYGVWALRLEEHSPDYFSVTADIRMLHTWSSKGFVAASFKPVSPARIQLGGIAPFGGLLLHRTEPFVSLVHYVMQHPPLRLADEELELVAKDIGLDKPASGFNALVRQICMGLF